LDLLQSIAHIILLSGELAQPVHQPATSDGADHTEPTADPHAQARGMRRPADYEEDQLDIHCVAALKLLFHAVKARYRAALLQPIEGRAA
jgi:hypothetical protein